MHRLKNKKNYFQIHQPMQGTKVPSLVQEDPTCHGAKKSGRYNYRASASRACKPQLLRLCATRSEACTPQGLRTTRDATAARSLALQRGGAPTATREKPHAATKTQHSHK